MEICEAPSLPIEKHMIPLLALPALHPHCVRSFLLDIVAREQIWCPDCCGLLVQTLWGGRTLLSPPGALLMSCREKRLLSRKEFASQAGAGGGGAVPLS